MTWGCFCSSRGERGTSRATEMRNKAVMEGGHRGWVAAVVASNSAWLVHSFRRALNYLEIKEIQLRGRKFTWSNNQNPPTMTRIDRAFCTPAWENCYSNPILQAQSSSRSDHYPLLLLPLIVPKIQPKFRFEAHWPQMPSFHEVVCEA
jgi:hypothetical protein